MLSLITLLTPPTLLLANSRRTRVVIPLPRPMNPIITLLQYISLQAVFEVIFSATHILHQIPLLLLRALLALVRMDHHRITTLGAVPTTTLLPLLRSPSFLR